MLWREDRSTLITVSETHGNGKVFTYEDRICRAGRFERGFGCTTIAASSTIHLWKPKANAVEVTF